VPERDIVFARTGEPASVEIEALGETRLGAITRVIPLAAEAARTFPVEIDLPNTDHRLLPGMFVWAHVPAGPRGKRLLVSKDAIVAQGPSKTVFVVRPSPDPKQPGEVAMPVSVTTGLELPGEVEINAPGLMAGDRVVTRANERLHGPTPVIPMPAGKEAPGSQPAPSSAAGAGHPAPAKAEPSTPEKAGAGA
jgi:multidrug efflux pump subunit AcrA (membrane-fusion protein)